MGVYVVKVKLKCFLNRPGESEKERNKPPAEKKGGRRRKESKGGGGMKERAERNKRQRGGGGEVLEMVEKQKAPACHTPTRAHIHRHKSKK